MDNSIAHIDLKRVDSDIEEKLGIIEAAQKELEILYKLKEYSVLYSINGYPAAAPAVTSVRNTLSTTQNKVTPASFVLHILDENGKLDTKTIIQAYADFKKEEYNNVRNAVFNVLTTLKKAGKIKGERIEEQNVTVYSKNRANALL